MPQETVIKRFLGTSEEVKPRLGLQSDGSTVLASDLPAGSIWQDSDPPARAYVWTGSTWREIQGGSLAAESVALLRNIAASLAAGLSIGGHDVDGLNRVPVTGDVNARIDGPPPGVPIGSLIVTLTPTSTAAGFTGEQIPAGATFAIGAVHGGRLSETRTAQAPTTTVGRQWDDDDLMFLQTLDEIMAFRAILVSGAPTVDFEFYTRQPGE